MKINVYILKVRFPPSYLFCSIDVFASFHHGYFLSNMKHNYIPDDENVAVNKVSRFIFRPAGWGEFSNLSANLESPGMEGFYEGED